MNRSTEQLIQDLAATARPVRPLARPHVRAAIWLALSLGYVAAIMFALSPRADLSLELSDPPFIIEEFAALATGVAAAVAAFATVVPGSSRRWVILPLLPLAIWLGSLGPGCIRELKQFGLYGIPLEHNLLCFPSIILLGAVPALTMGLMLRRGAPLTPHLSSALGGLAAAGIGNAGVRLIHPEDVTVMLLVWHVGGVMGLSILAGSAGRYLLNWQWMKLTSDPSS
jgi:hypothetical protein